MRSPPKASKNSNKSFSNAKDFRLVSQIRIHSPGSDKSLSLSQTKNRERKGFSLADSLDDNFSRAKKVECFKLNKKTNPTPQMTSADIEIISK